MKPSELNQKASEILDRKWPKDEMPELREWVRVKLKGMYILGFRENSKNK